MPRLSAGAGQPVRDPFAPPRAGAAWGAISEPQPRSDPRTARVIRGRERLLGFRAGRGLERLRGASSSRFWNRGKGDGGRRSPSAGAETNARAPLGAPWAVAVSHSFLGPKVFLFQRKQKRALRGKARAGCYIRKAAPLCRPARGLLLFGLEMK